MHRVVISATGLYTAPHTISNEELVASYNSYARLFNETNADRIAAGELGRLVGRIDVKAFRDVGALRIKGFWPEAGVRLTKGRQAKMEAELDRLAGFASLNGPAFYRLPVNAGTITLEKRAEPCVWPEKILSEAGPVTVFNPGFPVHWHVVN